jgi:cytochrome b6-f complex iron-sulfur subunit
MPEHLQQKTGEKPGTSAAPISPSPANSNDPSSPVNKTRRRFIYTFLGGYLGVNFLMFLRYFFPRALFEPNTIVNVGFPADFQVGVNQQFLQSNRIWVRKDPGRIFIIKAVCTHLGCTPDWEEAQNIFHCPCHGSEYDIDGINFAGPAPRPMDRCSIILQPDGSMVTNTAQLFMDEPFAGIDQFNDPGAFITI